MEQLTLPLVERSKKRDLGNIYYLDWNQTFDSMVNYMYFCQKQLRFNFMEEDVIVKTYNRKLR